VSPAKRRRPARTQPAPTTRPRSSTTSTADDITVHLLDVGDNAYGDSLLCLLGGTSVLIDGAHPENWATRGIHPAIPAQLKQLLRAAQPPYTVDLLIVSHNHEDHIGCLPKLVADGTLRARWAFVVDPDRRWGGAIDAATSDTARVVVNALQEEVQPPRADAASLAQFLADVAVLEAAYRQMLVDLESTGTTVVRHGTDDPSAMLAAFAPIGLKILGPSAKQLQITQRALTRATDALVREADALLQQDATLDPVELYRTLAFSRAGDAILPDAESTGAWVNLQSSVVRFAVGTQKLLFNGDMQLASTGSADPALQREVDALRSAIEAEGPFAFFKLSHHGSDNGMDADLFQGIGDTRWFGICGGEKSPSHPNPSILRLLGARPGRVHWARTDHNGLSTFTLGAQPTISVTRGVLDDDSPPGDPAGRSALATTLAAATPRTVSATPAVVVNRGLVSEGTVEVIVRTPAGAGSTRIMVEIHQEQGARGQPADRAATASSLLPPLHFAGGRRLPRLLFATNREGLVSNIGVTEAAAVIDAIRAAGQPIVTDLPSGGTWDQTMAVLRRSLPSTGEIEGVVVIGGYDIVVAQRLDTLPPSLRAKLRSGEPYDNFTVWSDEAYGDVRGPGTPRLPVSRIPDGRSRELVFAALSAPDSTVPVERAGIRNSARPFAEGIFGSMPGSEVLGISEPLLSSSGFPLVARRNYFMLHGHYADGSRFLGETATGAQPEAFNVGNVPSPAPAVVFAGCCWGALTVDQRAIDVAPAGVPTPKTVDSSIALTFLARGATAFVGCTGAHYSPDEAPYEFFGGPLHRAFWQAHAAGRAPAVALLEAKTQFATAMYHGLEQPIDQAIEFKTLHQFTCLGLGW
jgi:beta-lactamase superfamily II metal-dependent hydrolase